MDPIYTGTVTDPVDALAHVWRSEQMVLKYQTALNGLRTAERLLALDVERLMRR